MKANNIDHIEIPSSVKYIGQFAFSDCPSILSVHFLGKSQLEEIKLGAFQNCYSLGREIVFDKVDSGLRDYYEEHPDKSSVQSADEAGSRYIYRVGNSKNNESPYFIAVRAMTPSGVETDTCVADGQEISDYVGSQLEVSNYIDSDNFNVGKGFFLSTHVM